VPVAPRVNLIKSSEQSLDESNEAPIEEVDGETRVPAASETCSPAFRRFGDRRDTDYSIRSTTIRRPVPREPADSRFDDHTTRGTYGSADVVHRSFRGSHKNLQTAIRSLLGEHWLLFIADGSSLTCYRETVGDVVRPTIRAFGRLAVSSLRRNFAISDPSLTTRRTRGVAKR
jgi:hypothetical protein